MGACTQGFRLVGGAGLLLVAACGGGSSDADGGRQVATLELQDAFAASEDASGYRITQSTGQIISLPALGVDSDAPLDEENPTIVGEVTPDASHMRIDLSTLLGPLVGGDAPSVDFDMWTGPDRMVIDTRDYAVLVERNPSADLGPFEPGVSFVDLEAVGDESPDLLAALAGQGMADLGELADRLPRALEDVEQSGTSFTGTASYADLVEAMGSDPELTARSAAAGVALNLDVDPDVLTRFYVEYYEGADADISVDVGTDRTVEALRYEVDLSGLFPAMIGQGDELGLDIPADELDVVRDAFAEAVWTLEALIRFEVVDDLQVEPAPSTTDDRTEEWLAFFRAGGF